MKGLYDILAEYNLLYDDLRLLLRDLSKIIPLDYKGIERALDEVYDDTEYERYLNDKQRITA